MPLMSVPPLKDAVLRDLEALARDERVKKALDLALEEVPFAIEEQIHLCEIPAPTFHEERRADEMERRMRAYGLTDVTRDAIGNVIGRRPGSGSGPTIALVAHMDTVFPEGTDVRVKRGSTWMTVAPLSLARMTHLKEMGWFSAALLPWIRIQSLC